MAWLPLGPLIKARSVYDDLAVGGQFEVGAIHRTRCGALEIDTFTVVAAAVARAFEFVLAGFPIRRATEMRAARVDDEDAVGRAVDPDAIFLLPLGIDAQRVVGRITDLEDGGRLEERAGEEKTQEGDKPGSQESCDRTPHKAAAPIVDFAVLRTNGCQTGSGRSSRGTYRRRAHVAGCITDASRLRRIRFRFIRQGFRARHAIPPGK